MKNTIGIVLCLFFLLACKAETSATKPENRAPVIDIKESLEQKVQVEESIEPNIEIKEQVEEVQTEKIVRPDAEEKKTNSVPIRENTTATSMPRNNESSQSETTTEEVLLESYPEEKAISKEIITDVIKDVPAEVHVIESNIDDEEESINIVSQHDKWDDLLKKYVSSDGAVDYAGFKKAKAELENYLALLSNDSPQQSWSREKTMAYWINAYNAHTIHLIVNNYPLQSITDLDGGDPWKVKRIAIGDKMYSLNNIEHDILRPQFKDPRIHFAVNCAAKSCPKVYNRAWTEANLEPNLTKLTKEFVNNPKANTIGKNSVALSKIFEWYKSDFGDLIAFLNKYSTVKIDKGATLTYQDYNWDLNSK